MPVSAPEKFEDQRLRLVKLIDVQRPQGSSNNEITIVFDGQGGIISQDVSASVRVVYSKGESADEKIKDIVAQAENKKRIVVVTNDRDIQYAVRAQGASVLGVEEFLARMCPSTPSSREKSRPSTPTENESSKYISKTQEFKITEELKKIWLKEE